MYVEIERACEWVFIAIFFHIAEFSSTYLICFGQFGKNLTLSSLNIKDRGLGITIVWRLNPRNRLKSITLATTPGQHIYTMAMSNKQPMVYRVPCDL